MRSTAKTEMNLRAIRMQDIVAQAGVAVKSRRQIPPRVRDLTPVRAADIQKVMAQSYLIFDFGSNEEAAEQARRTIERWKQAFRLGKKVMMKFDRSSPDDGGGSRVEAGSGQNAGASEQPGQQEAGAPHDRDTSDGSNADQTTADQITLIVRLEFSDHERLSHQRWLARIPAEQPFKDAHPKAIASGDPEFATVVEQFQGGASRPHGFTGASS
jgi:hypothetical protein